MQGVVLLPGARLPARWIAATQVQGEHDREQHERNRVDTDVANAADETVPPAQLGEWDGDWMETVFKPAAAAAAKAESERAQRGSDRGYAYKASRTEASEAVRTMCQRNGGS